MQRLNIDTVEVKKAHLPVRELAFINFTFKQNIDRRVPFVFLDAVKSFSDYILCALHYLVKRAIAVK